METEKTMSAENPVQELSFHSLWPTNILQRRLAEGADFNRELTRIAREFQAEHFNFEGKFPYRSDSACLFSQRRSPALATLFRHVQESAYIYLSRFHPSIDLPATELLFTSFVNVQDKDKKWVNPHAHVESQFVVTYYCDVQLGKAEDPEDSPGALCFQDPRNLMATWMMRKENPMLTVELQTGTLVVFPGYLRHSTFPLFDETSTKTAIVTNVRMRDRKDAYQGTLRTAAEIMEWQNTESSQGRGMRDVRG